MGLFGDLIKSAVFGYNAFNKDNHQLAIETRITGVRTDAKGRPVYRVQASNYREVGMLTQGISVAGNVSKVATHIGRYQWEISVEDWNTDVDG